MKKKKKWHGNRSSLRERLQERAQRRDDSAFFCEPDPDCRQLRWENLPATLLQPMREHMFHKTVAAVLVVICLGLFSLFNLPVLNRFVDAVHYLTVYQMEPADLVVAAKPVMQSVRDFSWRGTQSGTPSPAPDPASVGEEQMAVPVNGILVSPYGPRFSESGEQMEMHYGIDVGADAGSPVFAAFSGTVSMVREHPDYGLTVYLEHPGNLVTIYGRVTHVTVQDGDRVNRGQEIAAVAPAPSGDSRLHFEVWQDSQPVNPEEFLPVME